jgi:hypothetical protein
VRLGVFALAGAPRRRDTITAAPPNANNAIPGIDTITSGLNPERPARRHGRDR